MLVDLSLNVDDLVASMAKKMGLRNPEEFSLQIEGSNGTIVLKMEPFIVTLLLQSG